MKLAIRTGKGALAIVLLMGAWAAQACTANYDEMRPLTSGNDFTYSGVGRPLTEWQEMWGSYVDPAASFYVDCTVGSTYSLNVSPQLAYVGYEVDGAAVFEVASNVGVQFRIVEGTSGFGSARSVGSTGSNLNVEALGTGRARFKLWYRYIAIVDVGSAMSLKMNPFTWAITNFSDGSLSFGKGSAADDIKLYVPPPPRSCWFVRSPPASVALPLTTVGMLERTGSGPEQAFTWSFNCNSTASGANITYTPGTSTTDPKSGRMSIEAGVGAAEGVELEVRRAISSGSTRRPVEFNKVSSRGTSGTEYLDVRYVPITGAELKPGVANGSLKINLDVY